MACGAWICSLLLGLLCGCASPDALLVLQDIGAGAGPSRLKAITPAPSRRPVEYEIAGRAGSGDLYLPADDSPQAGIVLVPGAVPEGKDDERLVTFATTLARARFAVLVPELSGYRELKVRATHPRELADALLYLSARQDLLHGKRVGFAAFSYAVGPAVLAALENDARTRVRFALSVGGYHDLRAAIRFFTTGYFEANGEPRHLEPNEYSKLVFAKSIADHLRDPRDRAIIGAMVEAKLADPTADLSSLAEGLGPEGRSAYRLMTNTDPAATPQLIDALPQDAIAAIDALTLADKDLTRLEARLILVHGKRDRLIPYSETLALGRSVAPSRARVFIINRILGHVDLSFSHAFSWQFYTQELPDAWRLLQAVDLLLLQRQTSVDVPAEGVGAPDTPTDCGASTSHP